MQQPKIAVFGGTGMGGKPLMKYLSTQPVEVIAFTRNMSKGTGYANVRWVVADPKNKSTFVEHLKGCAGVISILGAEDKKNVDIYTKGYTEIFKGMEEAGVNRLVMVTASHDHPETPWIFKNVIRPTFLSHVFDDMIKLDDILKNYKGPVQWTNLRPMKFVDGKRKKSKMVPSYSPESKGWDFETHMDDLAEACVKIWRENLYQNQFVDIGNIK